MFSTVSDVLIETSSAEVVGHILHIMRMLRQEAGGIPETKCLTV